MFLLRNPRAQGMVDILSALVKLNQNCFLIAYTFALKMILQMFVIKYNWNLTISDLAFSVFRFDEHPFRIFPAVPHFLFLSALSQQYSELSPTQHPAAIVATVILPFKMWARCVSLFSSLPWLYSRSEYKPEVLIMPRKAPHSHLWNPIPSLPPLLCTLLLTPCQPHWPLGCTLNIPGFRRN